jgi:hypothetical protein
MRETSRGGVPFGVEEENGPIGGNVILLGRERERLERRNELIENRLFLLSSHGLSTSAVGCRMCLSVTVVADVDLRAAAAMNSGSSDASREEGIESVPERGAYITNHISMWTRRQRTLDKRLRSL